MFFMQIFSRFLKEKIFSTKEFENFTTGEKKSTSFIFIFVELDMGRLKITTSEMIINNTTNLVLLSILRKITPLSRKR